MCAVDTCQRPAYAKGYCNAHYQRHRRGGSMTKPLRTYDRPRIVCTGPWPIACKDAWPISRMIWCDLCLA